MRGYFNNPEATAAAFSDGWFHTGDLGRLDDEGYLYVVDRLKDVIIRGGENIYAAEVEAALYEHPDITEAAIIGVPDERIGEEVGAVVRVRDGAAISPDDVRAHVAARLASFKVPSRVWITTDELPRNAAGKVLKRELRDDARRDRTHKRKAEHVDFDIPKDLADYLDELDEFIEREIKPLEQAERQHPLLRPPARGRAHRLGARRPAERRVGAAARARRGAAPTPPATTATRSRRSTAARRARTSGWRSSASTSPARASGSTTTCRTSTRSSATTSASSS